MEESTIPTWLKAAIKDGLRDYPLTKALVSDYRDNVLNGTPSDRAIPQVRARGRKMPGDPTQAAALKLLSEDYLRMEWFVKAIEAVYDTLEPDGKKVMEGFWKPVPVEKMAEAIHVSRGTVFRLKDAIVESVAFRLGLSRREWYRNLIQPPRAAGGHNNSAPDNRSADVQL